MPEETVYAISLQYQKPPTENISEEEHVHASPSPEPNIPFYEHYGAVAGIKEISFSDSTIKKGFIRKVYLILTLQLFVTFGVAVTFSYVPAIRNWMQTSGAAFYYAGYAVFGVSMLTLAFCGDLRKRTPWNYIFLGVITLSITWMIGTICSFYDSFAVLNAVAIILFVCLSVAVVTVLPLFDLNVLQGLAYMVFMVILFTGLSVVLVYTNPSIGQILSCVFAGIGAFIISLILLVDTILMTGSKGERNGIDPEEYILAALQIYVDIAYMFLFIFVCLLSCVGGGDGD